MIDLNTRIEDLCFPKGCQTIPSALKRTGKETLREVWSDYIFRKGKWGGVGRIRYALILNWFEKCVDISHSFP